MKVSTYTIKLMFTIDVVKISAATFVILYVEMCMYIVPQARFAPTITDRFGPTWSENMQSVSDQHGPIVDTLRDRAFAHLN